MADDGGISRLQQRMNAIPAFLKERMGIVAVDQAEIVADDMRAFAQASRDTGALIASITVTPGGQSTPPYSQPGGSSTVPENAAMITVGNSEVRYPHLVEYGTTHSQAKPFFWPAVRINREKIKAAFRREARKVIKEKWGK